MSETTPSAGEAPAPITKEQIEAATFDANLMSARFLAPMVEQVDQLLGEAISQEWLTRYRAFIASLPASDLKAQCINVLSVIEHMPVFLGNQRSIWKAVLDQAAARQAPAAAPPPPSPPLVAAPPESEGA